MKKVIHINQHVRVIPNKKKEIKPEVDDERLH